jgi:hypothetical protein
MNVRVSTRGDVRDNRPQRPLFKPMTIYLAADRTERFERSSVTNSDFITLVEREALPGQFRQASLVGSKEIGDDMVQGCGDRSIAMTKTDTRLRRESLRAADVTVTSHEDDRFLLHVDAEPASRQRARSRRVKRMDGLRGGKRDH